MANILYYYIHTRTYSCSKNRSNENDHCYLSDTRCHLIESPCLILLQWQREAGQLVLYRGIRRDDVIGRGTRLTSLGITRHFFPTLTHIIIHFFFFF